MSKGVLITGVNGFVGKHVADRFQSLGFEVTGVARQQSPGLEVASSLDNYIAADMLDAQAVNRLSLDGVSAIIHLAGRSSVGESFQQPGEYITQNPLMTHNLFDHAQRQGFEGRIVSVSTGALYDPNQPLPLSEESKTAPNSPYAIGKLSAEAVALYFKSRGIDAVIARPFNHIGPGQGTGFLLPDLYSQLHSSEYGQTLRVGNLATRRDYTDVRDIARAYSDLATAQSLGRSIYNICSGKSLSGLEITGIIKDASGRQDVQTTVDPAKVRPNEILDIRGDYSQLHADTGWDPQIDIRQTVADFVAHPVVDNR